MKSISLASGAIGMLVLVLGVIGRFTKEPTVTMLGHRFEAGTFLTLANTFLLIGIFLHLMSNRRSG